MNAEQGARGKQARSIEKISIYGDSISTFMNLIPYGYLNYYTAEVAYENGITSQQDMWFCKVCTELNAALAVNNSYAGSLVAGESMISACAKERCEALGDPNDVDAILIYLGSNDCGYGIPIGMDDPVDRKKFYGAYRMMLHHIKSRYSKTLVVCATLLCSYARGREEIFTSSAFIQKTQEYNDAICRAAQDENCAVADLAKFKERYETLDYCHPTKVGQETLAKLWIRCLKEIIKTEDS